MTDSPTSTSQTGPPDEAAEHAKQQARDLAESGKEQASEVVAEAKAQTSALLAQARDQARERADTQVDQLAGLLDQVSGELGQMADGASDSGGYLTALVRDGSQTAQSLAQRLNDGGLDGALDDVRQFARRRPVVFLASAFGVGLLLGRVTRNADFDEIKPDADESGRTDSDGARERVSATYKPPTPEPGTTAATSVPGAPPIPGEPGAGTHTTGTGPATTGGPS